MAVGTPGLPAPCASGCSCPGDPDSLLSRQAGAPVAPAPYTADRVVSRAGVEAPASRLAGKATQADRQVWLISVAGTASTSRCTPCGRLPAALSVCRNPLPDLLPSAELRSARHPATRPEISAPSLGAFFCSITWIRRYRAANSRAGWTTGGLVGGRGAAQ